MKPITVQAGDNISEVENGTYIHCKELNKGVMKKDFGSLNVSIQTFENIVESIESKDLDFLQSIGLDSVLFGIDENGIGGQLLIGKRRYLTIKRQIENLPDENKNESFINTLISTEKEMSEYFNISNLSTFIENTINSVLGSVYTNYNYITLPNDVNNSNFKFSTMLYKEEMLSGQTTSLFRNSAIDLSMTDSNINIYIVDDHNSGYSKMYNLEFELNRNYKIDFIYDSNNQIFQLFIDDIVLGSETSVKRANPINQNFIIGMGTNGGATIFPGQLKQISITPL